MDRIDNYRQIVMQLLEEYNQYRSDETDIDQDVLFDQERDHYQLMIIGWQGSHRASHPLIHIDIKGDKVWLQVDNTDAEFTGEGPDGSVNLILDGQTLTLPREPSGSGAKYSDGETTLWTQGEEGVIEVDGEVVYDNCTATAN